MSKRIMKGINKFTRPVIILGLVCVALSGCNNVETWETDQELRTELFFRCMEALPAGPQETKYNDWDEVVGKCDSVAYYQARRCVKNCKPKHPNQEG